jgi:thiamine transporter ThiT
MLATRTARSRRLLARHDVVGPVLVTAAVLLALVGARLVQYDRDPTGFVQFGRAAAPVVMPPADARIASDIGYDGQFFYVQAVDPLLRDRARSALIATNGEYRAQRVLYPALAYVAAAGSEDAVPWTMLLLNVAAALAATAAVALFARDRGASGWWALAVGLCPGVVLAVLRDLSEPLAVAGLVSGLVAWRLRRPWIAGAALTAAVLAREVMVLAVIAIAFEAVWRRLSKRDAPVVGDALRACVPPIAAFAAWQLYLLDRFDRLASSTTPDGQFLSPFEGLIDSADRAISDPSLGSVVWDLGFLILVVAAMVVAVLAARRGPNAPAVTALCFAVLAVLVTYDADHWNYTRITAPLMASLVVLGLDEEDRAALTVPALAACLTLLIPVAFSAGAGA